MNPKTFHILNGDVLAEQFPTEISGETLVARECLVDGEVYGRTPEELFDTRAKFLSMNYPDCTPEDYYNKTVTEFQKILKIPDGSAVCLWFEDDLFCQVNCWFVIYLLKEFEGNLYLARPETHTPYGFGGLSSAELIQAYQKKKTFSDREEWNKLWPLYQQTDIQGLLYLAQEMQANFPFLLPAVQALEDSNPNEPLLGRPAQSLIQIRKELDTAAFGPVFQAFCQRESIYGYGDLQVKRLLDLIDQS